MKKFEILKIVAFVYERFIVARDLETNKILNLYFVEYNEDIEDTLNGIISRKVGDTIEGELSIWLGDRIKKSFSTLSYVQPRRDSPYIEIVVDVDEIIDDITFYAITNLQKERLSIEVEDDIFFKKGDRIYLEGELRIEPKEYLDDN